MNRRSFIHSLGAGVVGTLTVRSHNVGATGPAPVIQAGSRSSSIAETIRIGTNENPYGPAPSVLEAILEASPEGNRYPGPLTSELVSAIAARHNVSEDRVLLSGGSGDVLRASVYAHTSRTRALVTGIPSYEAPTRSAQHIGAPVRGVPLTRDLRLDLKAMAVRAVGSGLVYICNPNNPASTAVSADNLGAFVDKVTRTSPGTYVLIDEAYFEYGDASGFDSAIPLVSRYPALIVARSFSKIHAMAGMRVGYAIAHPNSLNELGPHHSASGLSAISLAAAMASLGDIASIERNQSLNREVRAFTTEAFASAGYTVAASDANFIFVNVRRSARLFQDACLRRGVQIGRAFPPMNTWARISIGTHEEMSAAVPVFLKTLAAPPQQTASLDHLARLPNELT